MPSELISYKTRTEFRDYLVGNSVLREIHDEFRGAGIQRAADYDPEFTSKRRRLVEQYYRTLDFSESTDVRKLLEVIGSVLFDVKSRIRSAPARFDMEERKAQVQRIEMYLERDGYVYEDGRVRRAVNVQSLEETLKHAEALDAQLLRRHIQRIEEAVNTDPAQAIGQAKELVETTCKTILRDLGEPADDNPKFHQLVGRVRDALELLPEDVPERQKGQNAIKRLLGNLGQIPQAMAELRNSYGTGHGKDGKWRGLTPRHARLAVGSAVTLANFLFETYRQRQER